MTDDISKFPECCIRDFLVVKYALFVTRRVFGVAIFFTVEIFTVEIFATRIFAVGVFAVGVLAVEIFIVTTFFAANVYLIWCHGKETTYPTQNFEESFTGMITEEIDEDKEKEPESRYG